MVIEFISTIHKPRRIHHRYKDRIKIKCLSCGKEKDVLPCKKKSKFCSKECFWEFQRFNWKGRDLISLDLEKVRNLYKNENKSCAEIARIMGSSQQTISRRINFLNIQKRPTGTYKRDEQSIKNLSLRFKGKTYEEIMGVEKANELKELRRINFSGPISDKHRKNMSIAKKGKPNYKGRITWKKKYKDGECNKNIGALGRDNLAYVHGKAYEPYTAEFHNKLRRLIRKRDNQICMLCNTHREKLKSALSVHHINYNKKICIPENLISLCRICHTKTNFNRNRWTNFFQSLLSEKYNYKYSEDNEIILNIGEIK